jgi:hypothetical protein
MDEVCSSAYSLPAPEPNAAVGKTRDKESHSRKMIKVHRILQTSGSRNVLTRGPHNNRLHTVGPLNLHVAELLLCT